MSDHPTSENGVMAFNVKCEHCGITHGSDTAHRCIEAEVALRMAAKDAVTPKPVCEKPRCATARAQRDAAVALLRKVIATHCPNDKLFCGSCSEARTFLETLP